MHLLCQTCSRYVGVRIVWECWSHGTKVCGLGGWVMECLTRGPEVLTDWCVSRRPCGGVGAIWSARRTMLWWQRRSSLQC